MPGNLTFDALKDLAAKGEGAAARAKFLQAKTFYSIARFPHPLTPLKEEANQDCIRISKNSPSHFNENQ